MKKFLLLTFIVAVIEIRAQQDPLTAQYMNTPMVVNPAYAGMSRDLNLAADYRKQWAGFEGSPTTLTASGHMSLQKNKMGAGFILLNDKMASTSTTELQGTYAYHLPITGQMNLSFGAQLGVINYRTDYSDLTINPNDPKFTGTSQWQPNFGAGLILTDDRFYVSISSLKMLESSTELGDQGLYRRNAYLLGSYAFQMTSRLRLKPYFMTRFSAGSPASFDVGTLLLGDDSYSVGAFTRDFHTYGVSGQLKLDEFIRVGYVFEIPTNQSAGLGYTTHELQLILRFSAFSFHDIGAVRNF